MIKVNDYIISEKEFDMACQDFAYRARLNSLTEQHLESVANQLIDAKLLLEEANKDKINVEDEQLNAAINNMKQSYINTSKDEEFVKNYKNEYNEEPPADFEEYILKSGDTVEKLRERVRSSLTLQKYLEEKFISVAEISEDDAKKYYDQHSDKFVSQESVRASHILFDEKDYESAIDVRRELMNGEDFNSMAQQHSNCPSKQNGGDLGFLEKGKW